MSPNLTIVHPNLLGIPQEAVPYLQSSTSVGGPCMGSCLCLFDTMEHLWQISEPHRLKYRSTAQSPR